MTERENCAELNNYNLVHVAKDKVGAWGESVSTNHKNQTIWAGMGAGFSCHLANGYHISWRLW